MPIYLPPAGKSITVIGDVPAGFNTFQFPAIVNSFYGDGIPFGKIMVAAIPGTHSSNPSPSSHSSNPSTNRSYLFDPDSPFRTVTFLTYLESVSVGRKYALGE